MFKKLLVLITCAWLSGCTLIGLPIAVIETAASVVKMPISVIGKVADAVNNDDEEEEGAEE